MCHGASLQIIFNSLIFIFNGRVRESRAHTKDMCIQSEVNRNFFFPHPLKYHHLTSSWASFYFRLVAVGLFLKIFFCAILKCFCMCSIETTTKHREPSLHSHFTSSSSLFIFSLFMNGEIIDFYGVETFVIYPINLSRDGNFSLSLDVSKGWKRTS